MLLNLFKSSDFIRAVAFVLTAIGVVVEPAQIDIIVAGGLAFVGLVHAVRAAIKQYFNKS